LLEKHRPISTRAGGGRRFVRLRLHGGVEAAVTAIHWQRILRKSLAALKNAPYWGYQGAGD